MFPMSSSCDYRVTLLERLKVCFICVFMGSLYNIAHYIYVSLAIEYNMCSKEDLGLFIINLDGTSRSTCPCKHY